MVERIDSTGKGSRDGKEERRLYAGGKENVMLFNDW